MFLLNVIYVDDFGLVEMVKDLIIVLEKIRKKL